MSRTHLRSVLVAYGIAALALVLVYVLTQEAVVLAVLGAVAVFCALQAFTLSRGGSSTGMVHDHARTEAVARQGNIPPEKRGNF